MKTVETSVLVASEEQIALPPARASLLVFVWTATLLVSALPQILLRELQVLPGLPFFWIRIGLLVALIALGFVWRIAQPLRLYFLIFLVLYLAEALFEWVGVTALWRGWFADSGGTFSRAMLSSQLLRLGVAITMIGALWLIYRQRSKFFLTVGELNATAEPVRWIGMMRPAGWVRFGLLLALCITLGTLAFLVLAARPSMHALVQVLPLLPLILVLAGTNAFSEGVAYRAALLAPLHGVVGKSHALLLTALLFGLWHYYGVPYGVLGVLMAGALGWLLSKSILETKGMFWAWFIHFAQDVAIFVFLAAGSITPGGS